ncbi:MAG: FAD-linked oxidase C-terminal domain-containing protein, partial [Pseudomonadota bacterium]
IVLRGQRIDKIATNTPDEVRELFRDLSALGLRERQKILGAFPDVSRRVGGYLIDALTSEDDQPINLATLLCGSEGTLAVSQKIKVRLADQPINKALGVCHFPTFRSAMEAAQHIVKLGPVAVEVVDATLISLARDIAMFQPVMDAHVMGRPEALLLVEFAEPDDVENLHRLNQLDELMGDLGHPNAVGKVSDRTEQAAIWGVRTSGLNIMMSMKSEGKPVSFIEDAAVPLEHLADYTERLTAVFEKHGTKGTWYAHASVGCLHVRPVLNLKLEKDAATMRAIAEEAFDMVRAYKGAHSGEHGDGLVRSEFHERMYGRETVELFETIKDRFDPTGALNPGKIVRPPRMNDRTLFRYKPDYHASPMVPEFDWQSLGYPGGAAGLQGAVEMCNNNGACRKLQGGAMCPSYRVTRNERDLTRGRANTLRLALSGQLGDDALGSDDMLETMKLCVSCKACKRECPTGVDMAKMKVEVLAAANRRRGLSLRDRLVAYLPRYAPAARFLAPLLNLRNRSQTLARLMERTLGISAKRSLPAWRFDRFKRRHRSDTPQGHVQPIEVALLADSFNSAYEGDNLEATAELLSTLGYKIRVLGSDARRPLCCGRTYLSAGLVTEAKTEARRLFDAAREHVEAGGVIVGIEPSCLMTMRDEFLQYGFGDSAKTIADNAFLIEEFLVREAEAGRLPQPLGHLKKTVHVHTHCHQKAFGADGPVASALRLVDALEVKTIDSSCCGMAGAFGYQSETHDTSMAMGELTLFPAVRAADDDALIAADGFSCRHQIADGTDRKPQHVARILRDAVMAAKTVQDRS